MTQSPIGALLFLVIGVLLYGFIRFAVYPRFHWRYEAAKVRGTQGRDPESFLIFVKLTCLIVMPLVGYFYSGAIWEILR